MQFVTIVLLMGLLHQLALQSVATYIHLYTLIYIHIEDTTRNLQHTSHV